MEVNMSMCCGWEWMVSVLSGSEWRVWDRLARDTRDWASHGQQEGKVRGQHQWLKLGNFQIAIRGLGSEGRCAHQGGRGCCSLGCLCGHTHTLVTLFLLHICQELLALKVTTSLSYTLAPSRPALRSILCQPARAAPLASPGPGGQAFFRVAGEGPLGGCPPADRLRLGSFVVWMNGSGRKE